jgi:hypothetical protein
MLVSVGAAILPPPILLGLWTKDVDLLIMTNLYCSLTGYNSAVGTLCILLFMSLSVKGARNGWFGKVK